MLKVRHKGSFNRTEAFFNRILKMDYLNILSHYGKLGVQALAANTPSDSGKTAESWDFGIEQENGKITLYWTNSNENNGVNIALVLLHGHGTQNGTYISGIDYVNPALQPVFERIANEVWKEVTR